MSEQGLPAATLDTLPINVAVLDRDGDILFTNRAWREFALAESDADTPEELGTNYFAAVETAESTSEEALAGIRSVLDGAVDLAVEEYPCHSPTERRWFLMRASPVEIAGERRVVVAHVDITRRKEAELAADERADQLAHLLERVEGLVREVTAGAVEARTRAAVERTLCEAFVDAEPYTFAWVGRPDLRAESLVPRAWHGAGPEDVEARTLSLSTDTPAARAHRTGELQVVATAEAADGDGESAPVDGGPDDEEPDEPVAADGADAVAGPGDAPDAWGPVPGARAVAAVPLSYRATTYGVLSVYADRVDAFDDRERVVLRALGDVAATAVHAATSGRVLEADSVVEIEVELRAPGTYLATLAPDEETTLHHRDALLGEDGRVRAFVAVEGADVETVRERATGSPDVLDLAVLTTTETGALLELELGEALVADVADLDGVTGALSATDGSARATLSFPDETAARAAFEHLRERYEGVELAGYRERERAADTAGGFRAELESTLTDRQLTALRTAYHSGYFEWPRDVSGEEVAAAMDITRATFHQHLREAQRKLAAALLESGRL